MHKCTHTHARRHAVVVARCERWRVERSGVKWSVVSVVSWSWGEESKADSGRRKGNEGEWRRVECHLYYSILLESIQVKLVNSRRQQESSNESGSNTQCSRAEQNKKEWTWGHEHAGGPIIANRSSPLASWILTDAAKLKTFNWKWPLCILPFWTFNFKCTCVLCQAPMAVCIRDRETAKENKCCFWAPSIRELVSLLVCACVYKGGGCRQTGSRGLQNRTGHHNSSARSLATDRQAGVNADGSLIGICHQQPTKSIYLQGETKPYSHTQTNTHSTQTEHITNLMHTHSFLTHHCHGCQCG